MILQFYGRLFASLLQQLATDLDTETVALHHLYFSLLKFYYFAIINIF